MSFWNQNLSAPAQLAKVKDMTQGECARALRDPDTQPATKGALLRRLRMFNQQRQSGGASVPASRREPSGPTTDY